MFAYFEKLIDAYPSHEPDTPPKTLLAFCWHYTKGVWPLLAMMSAAVAVISILEILLFSFMGNLVDWLASANRETFLQDEGTKLIWMGVVVVLILPAISLLHSLLLHQTILGNYPMLVRWLAHRYVLGQSYAFYQDEFAGRIATKVMQTALAIREAAMKLLDVMVYVVVYFGGALVLMAYSSVWLMLPFIAWLVLYVLLLRYYLPKLKEVSVRQSDARSLMTGRIVDSYTNITTVKLFAHTGREETYAKEAMDEFLNTVHPQMRLSTALNFWLNLINNFLLFAVGAIAIWLWLGSVSSIGAVAAGGAIALRLSGMSHWIMWELSGLFENIGMAQDGMNMLSKERDVLDKPDAKALVVDKGQIEFDQMRFHYGKEGGVIEDLSLTLKPGEKVGVVGRSGAGKTTVMNLLLRMFDLQGGRILIDGQNIADVTQDSLRSKIGVVTQDTSLLHRSVRDNIAYGRPDASDEEIIAATKRANAHEFILDLEDLQGRKGYDAHVGERGVKLSGGQRQRIAIARVFLKDAPILVLDEATSALDSEVEAAIQENLLALMDGKTVIAIAHRLSTIAALDRLIVLDGGDLIEEGTHDGLVEAGGLYAQLWERQSGGFLSTPDAEEAAE